MKKRLISIISATVLLSMSMSGFVYADNEATTYDETVRIANAEELCEFAEAYNEENGIYTDKNIYVMLTDDIDMTGIEDYSSIGIDNDFDDVFNGNSYTISNLVVTSDTCQGIFGDVEGTIENVNVINSIITTSKEYTAVLVSDLDNATIRNCHIDGCKVLLEENSTECKIAGLAADVESSNIISCSVTNTEIRGYENVALLAGDVEDSIIKNCFTSGNVYAAEYYAGGIAGYVECSTVINCGTTADVTGMYYGDSGGFIGCLSIDDGTFENCYSSGNIHAENLCAGYSDQVFSAGLLVGDIYDCETFSVNNLFYNTVSEYSIYDDNSIPVECDTVIIGVDRDTQEITFAPVASEFDVACTGVDFTSKDDLSAMVNSLNNYVDTYNADLEDGEDALCHWTVSDDGTYAVPCTIAVTLYDYSGNEIDTVYGYYGQSIDSILPESAPEVTDYTFDGWDENGTNLTGPVSSYAQYYLSHLETEDHTGEVNGNLGDAATFTVTPVDDTDTLEDVYDSLRVLLDNSSVDSENTIVYDINLINSDFIKMQPDGSVSVTLTLPEGFDTKDLKLFRVETDGTVKELEFTVEAGRITFTTDHFSYYVLTIADDLSNDIPPTGDNTSVAALLLMATVAGAALTISFRKKAEN